MHKYGGFLMVALAVGLSACSVVPNGPSMENGFQTAAVRPTGASPTNFKIEIDGVIQGSFERMHIAGKPQYLNVVLKRGQVKDISLLEWHRQVLSGKAERKVVTLTQSNQRGETRRLVLHGAQPTRLELAPAHSRSDTYIVEELEFAVERVERASKQGNGRTDRPHPDFIWHPGARSH